MSNYHCEKTYIYFFLLLSVSFFCVSCQCQRRRLPDILDPPPPAVEQKEERPPTSLKTTISNDTYHTLCSCWAYLPKEVEVLHGQTILDAVLEAYPDLGWAYHESSSPSSSLGGAKLIGEMSADWGGYYSSKGPVTINILPLSEMHLRWVRDRRNIFIQTLEGNITLKAVKIPYSLLSFKCSFELQNNTDQSQVVVIPAGQMIESEGNDVQNVVVTSTETVRLRPYEQTSVSVPVLCAAQHRGNPQGFSARVTPFILDIPTYDYHSQKSVWNDIETKEVTFYAWRSGDRTQAGTSTFGHAFVRLPGIGVYGFGAEHRGKRLLLGEKGVIFDHSRLLQYATDSCRIKVSEKQARAMIDKLKELQRNVPLYELGRYDCTSFVMDIADAGEIKYGPRAMIHWPIGFIEELKIHYY